MEALVTSPGTQRAAPTAEREQLREFLSFRLGAEEYGIEIVHRVPLVSPPTLENIAYLRAKQEKLGHLLGLVDGE